MKTQTLILVAALVAGSSGYLIKVPVPPERPSRPASTGWLHIEKLLLPLFDNVCEESTNPMIVRLAQEFTLDPLSSDYEKPEVIVNLQKLQVSQGLLPKGEIFTESDKDHIDELHAIYDVLYYAKSFDTFYKAAAWARQNVNCGLFVNAIYLAIIKRRDTEKIEIPAPYEILPNYFIRDDVIIKASSLLAGEYVSETDGVSNEGNSYTLTANYTSSIDNIDESRLAYFHEDIGLNSFYFLSRLQKAPWFNDLSDMGSGYGEYLFHFMKQLATRYNLERYSNGLTPLENIDWETCTLNPYDSMLVYSNGKEFGRRENSVNVASCPYYQTILNLENDLSTVVTHMMDTGYNKSQILNNLMEILVTRDNSFESMARLHLGKDGANQERSAMEHYMTTLRDPAYWKLNKKMVDMVDNALKALPSYTRNELYFPGVEVLNVEIKKVMTMFESYKVDVTDALKSSTENVLFRVNIDQTRLSHKPFAMKLNISSLVAQKGLVKLYLGPKVLPGEFASKRNQFVLLDNFEVNLKVGSNVISRSTDQMKNFANDYTPLKVIRKKIEDAEFGLDVLPLQSVESFTGYPSRLILPKGTPEGLAMQIFVFVAPFVKISSSGIYNMLPVTEFNSAVLSPGYPLDLTLDETQLFSLPNIFLKDITITHKDNKGSNYGGQGTKKWDGGESSQSYGRKEPFDYTSKKSQEYGAKRESFDYTVRKSQYGKKEDYAAKRENYKGKYVTPDKKEDQEIDNINEQDDVASDVGDNEESKKEQREEDSPQMIYDDKEKNMYKVNQMTLGNGDADKTTIKLMPDSESIDYY